MNPEPEALLNFDGLTRLFPLPSLVFFPHALQALHMFEPRYRELMTDTVADDMLMTPVLLRPGWEEDYDFSPTVERVACLGRVVHHQELPDGRWNLMLRGVSRVRIVEEVPSGKLYRAARVELLSDIVLEDTARLRSCRESLAEAVKFHASSDEARAQITKLFEETADLGTLCDILSFALPLPLEFKQELLNEPVVFARAELLIDRLKPRPRRDFPPRFSSN